MHTRLDRFISKKTGINRRDVKRILAQGRITIDGEKATNAEQIINQFNQIFLDNNPLQNNIPRYLMMNKPVGVVSANKDHQHKTLFDLIDPRHRANLHIAGRLDLNSSGLILLTNDSCWSKNFSHPQGNIAKRYRVTLKNPLSDEYITRFSEGFYFPFEGITTRPASLKIISHTIAEVILTEGRYHQIKRMFGRFRNPVLQLHREAIGKLELDKNLQPGDYRDLTEAEVNSVQQG